MVAFPGSNKSNPPQHVAYYVGPVFTTTFSAATTLYWTYEKQVTSSITQTNNFEMPVRNVQGTLFKSSVDTKFIDQSVLAEAGNTIYNTIINNSEMRTFWNTLGNVNGVSLLDAGNLTTFLSQQLNDLDFMIAYTFWNPSSYQLGKIINPNVTTSFSSLEGVAVNGYEKTIYLNNGNTELNSVAIFAIQNDLEDFANVDASGAALALTTFRGTALSNSPSAPPISFFGKANEQTPDPAQPSKPSPNQKVGPWDFDAMSVAGASLTLSFDEPEISAL